MIDNCSGDSGEFRSGTLSIGDDIYDVSIDAMDAADMSQNSLNRFEQILTFYVPVLW